MVKPDLPTGGNMSDEHIGVPRERAAEIVDVSVDRLNRWAGNGLVKPSIMGTIGGRNYHSYSLDDLVQGRIVRQIEDRGVHVRKIRGFVDALKSTAHPRPLASFEWGVEGGEMYAQFPDESWVGGRRPNQIVMIEIIDPEAIRVAAREAAIARVGEPGTTESRRAVMGSKTVFAGTRVPVASVQTYLKRGYDVASILAEYPDLASADVEEARRLLAS